MLRFVAFYHFLIDLNNCLPNRNAAQTSTSLNLFFNAISQLTPHTTKGISPACGINKPGKSNHLDGAASFLWLQIRFGHRFGCYHQKGLTFILLQLINSAFIKGKTAVQLSQTHYFWPQSRDAWINNIPMSSLPKSISAEKKVRAHDLKK